jgi:hypothetical protein
LKTDTSERGLESLIVKDFTSTGWVQGDPNTYDREYCLGVRVRFEP